jgi:pyridoxal phosphate enzyme (YggS family)
VAERFSLRLPHFTANYARIRAEVDALRPDGEAPPPTIVIVTKYLVPEDTARLRKEGYGPLGENRAQKLEQKTGIDEDREGWHFIGHLQRNKIAAVIPRVSLVHSLDSVNLARAVDSWVERYATRRIDALAQVNVCGETTKGGLTVGEAEEMVPRWIDAHRNLRLRGLMTMAPQMPEEDCRFVFRSLRELLARIRSRLPSEDASVFQELSMGMSSDYRAAVSEGATMIRLGTVLYQGAGEAGGIQ